MLRAVSSPHCWGSASGQRGTLEGDMSDLWFRMSSFWCLPQTNCIWVPAPTSRKHFHHPRSPPPSPSRNRPPCYECQHRRAVLPGPELLISGITQCMLFGSVISHPALSLWGSSTWLCVVCVYLLLYISLFCEYSIYLSCMQLMGIWVVYNFWLFWAMLLEHSCAWLLVNVFIHFFRCISWDGIAGSQNGLIDLIRNCQTIFLSSYYHWQCMRVPVAPILFSTWYY